MPPLSLDFAYVFAYVFAKVLPEINLDNFREILYNCADLISMIKILREIPGNCFATEVCPMKIPTKKVTKQEKGQEKENRRKIE